MRRFALGLLLCALFSPPRGDAAGIEAGPSCAGWAQPPAVAMRGTVQSHDMHGPYSELADPLTGATASRWTLDGLHQADGSNGAMRWTQDFSGTTHWLDSDHAKAVARTDAWIERRGWCAANARRC